METDISGCSGGGLLADRRMKSEPSSHPTATPRAPVMSLLPSGKPASSKQPHEVSVNGVLCEKLSSMVAVLLVFPVPPKCGGRETGMMREYESINADMCASFLARS